MIWLAIAFEAGLGLAGVALAGWLEVPVAARLRFSPDVARRALLALVPMLGLLAFARSSQLGPIARLWRQVRQLVGEHFGDARWWELAAIALAAGAGEELLFRGALQPLAERWFGPAAGLIAVSILFGAMHAASITYFLLATAIGLYLGWIAQRYDDLVTPIFVHAAYDWAALVVLCRQVRD